MITVTTDAGKRALASALAKHDPDFITDLRWFADAFGPLASVGYESTSRGVQKAVQADVEAARLRHTALSRQKAQTAIQAAKAAISKNGENK